MYSWKSKFKFGRSREEKQKQKESSVESSSSIPKSPSGDIISSRKETITKSNSTIAPDLKGPPSSQDGSGMKGPSSSSGSSIVNGPNNPQSQSQSSSSSEPVQDIPNDSTSSSGIMTIKVYNGDGFMLPFPITSNQQILTKLLSSGIAAPNSQSDINALLSQLSNLQLSSNGGNDNNMSMNTSDGINNKEDLLQSKNCSKFIPATIILPGSSNLNPLLYFTIEFDNTVATIEPEYGTMLKPVFNKISTFDTTRKLPFLKIDVFARIPSILLPSKPWQDEAGNNNPKLKEIFQKINSNQDIHLDSLNLPVNLKFNTSANIRLYNHQWISLENGQGKINISIDYKPAKNKHLSIDDFDLLKVIGKGSFGKVMQVRKKDTQKVYALKAIRKSYIVSKSEVTHTLAERTVLARINCPFIVPLKFSFQSPEKLYLVLAFINGGELFYHLQKEGRFDLSRARFYTAELLCALETLHKLDVIYRDLKPENILLDYQGHIALCDFGLCKLNMKDSDKTDTFCGTPEYLAPELLLGQGYSKVVDWWTLGVLLYEMLTGLPPYYDEDVPKMYKKILQNPLRFPDGFDEDAKDLLIGLLSRDPTRRLGYNGTDEIKNHPFFSQLSWHRLLMKGYIPPYKPPVINSMDTSNFDQEFTREKPVDSVVDEFLSESVQKQFGGWTYVGNEQLGSSR
ncbi:serine/threonine-protein kinase NDAI_0K01370 [Naumovozyma dairenensis CBS 421]|uniref:non-specific serine/threonine protein kinase n=1 Tax=Naumovozyma dairenensis (strain ATCC 10597 / BCRC 20456 / CBS 421 / NBRC 0211 / NRRL Y-12639) TaxID=1071378 RepID=G0WHR7_NAUDC|nr:hypothetical protein NDAI_0K01370 [Naumovozyma dairenensis CBS 421]CCD27328.1 hypothetical protein NDAI_0K01370 [Naumovozyma dairenensis CBS 421]